MMIHVLFQLGLASAFATFVHLFVPRLAMGGVLFGVTVPEGFTETAAGRALVSRYRRQVLAAGLAGLASIAAACAAGSEQVAGLLLGGQVLLCTVAWVLARARTRPHAAAPTLRRTAGLAEPRPLPPVLDAAPFLILAAAAVLVTVRWEDIPERFPLHWRGDGVVDRWAMKSPAEVFQPLVVGTALALGLLGLRAATLAFSARRAGDPRGLALRGLTRAILTGTATFLSVLFGAIAINPLVSAGPGVILGVAGAGLVVLLVALGIASTRLAALPSPGPGDGTPDERWRLGGLFYVNPDDPAVFVPKRAGLGYTVNLGRPGGVVALAAMLGVPALIALLTHLLAR